MGAAELVVVGALVVAFSLVSKRIGGWPITMPMVFVGAGALADAVGFIDVSADREVIVVFAEITLAVILFSDASRIDIRRLRRYLGIPVRLLAIGLPLTMLAGTFVNGLLFPDLAFAEVALIAVILSPTDAALGAAVIEDPVVPRRERLALNVESGVNDGLAVPAVAILTAVALGESRTTASWAGFVSQQIGGGIAVGLTAGGAAIWLLREARRRDWADGRYEQLATFLVPMIALFGAEAVEGNSFIAAFVAGLTFGAFGATAARASGDDVQIELPERLGEFTEDASQLMGLVAFFVFGNVLVVDSFDHISVPIVVCAVMMLTVGRMVPVWVALIGTSMRAPSRLFVGWFGPRGLASIIFGLLLLEETESMTDAGEEIFSVIAVTVTASVVLHGASAAWGARSYGRWAAEAAARSDEERDSMEMDGDHDAFIPRLRWSRRSS